MQQLSLADQVLICVKSLLAKLVYCGSSY